MCPQFSATRSASVEVDGVANKHTHVHAGLASRVTAVDVHDTPRIAAVGRVVRPEFGARASVVGAKVKHITNDHVQIFSSGTSGRACVDVIDTRGRSGRRVVLPQLHALVTVMSVEVQHTVDDVHHVASWIAVTCARTNVGNLPCRSVRSVVRPQFLAGASIIRREVESILNEDARIFSRVATD